MSAQDNINYHRVEAAIKYIEQNFKDQPSLDEIARAIHLSPYHFQRIFTEWAGTSPKKFLQYTSISYAKNILREEKATLFDTSFRTGLSGTGRLHDLFVNIEGMTPAEYKEGGKNLEIKYNFYESPFGEIIVGSTQKGVCHLTFFTDREEALNALYSDFPNAKFRHQPDSIHQNAISIFNRNWDSMQEIKLHLKGSAFQLKVWETLLKTPFGKLTTYGNLAKQIDSPSASRAVGSAVGANPAAYLIPCHRVIRSTGKMDGYRWGDARKKAIIGWEAVREI